MFRHKWVKSYFPFLRPGSINLQWMIYMAQPCGTSVEEVHRMTTDAVESSNNAALGAVSVEAVESVSMARIVGKSVRVAG